MTAPARPPRIGDVPLAAIDAATRALNDRRRGQPLTDAAWADIRSRLPGGRNIDHDVAVAALAAAWPHLLETALDQLRADADDESVNPTALWRRVDRQWSKRYRADVRVHEAVFAAVRAEHQPRWFDTSVGRWRTGGVPDPHARATCATCTGQDYPCRTLYALPVEPALGAAADQHSGTVNGG